MDTAEIRSAFARCPSAAPLADDDIWQTFVDPSQVEEFWVKQYLQSFVDTGAGKVKFLTGSPGSGKTHFLRHLELAATRAGYVCCRVDARTDKIAPIDDLYRAVARGVNWEQLLNHCALKVIREHLGYSDFSSSPQDFRFWAESTLGRSQSSLLADLRDATDKFVRSIDIRQSLREPIRASLSRRTSREGADETALVRWLQGERLSMQERKGLPASSNIDRHSARSMLLSLAVLAHTQSAKGLLVLVDNVAVIAGNKRIDGVPYYTRGTRDQAYEMIRELIDESHLARHLFVVFAGETELFENQKTGVPAYPALWDRVQPQIRMKQFNRFADLMDLDRAWTKADLQRLLDSWLSCPLLANTQRSDANAAVADAWAQGWAAPRRTVLNAMKRVAAAGGGGRA